LRSIIVRVATELIDALKETVAGIVSLPPRADAVTCTAESRTLRVATDNLKRLRGSSAVDGTEENAD
jgi:hypothetical protein